MEKESQPRLCQSCGKTIRGRSDKKFCHDNCRNQFNNKIRESESLHLKNINRILRRNRKILRDLLTPETDRVIISRAELEFLQFHFSFYTHSHTNKSGNTFHFCYEFGYLTISPERIIVIKRSAHLDLLNPLPQCQ
jgi:hypothetical protein